MIFTICDIDHLGIAEVARGGLATDRIDGVHLDVDVLSRAFARGTSGPKIGETTDPRILGGNEIVAVWVDRRYGLTRDCADAQFHRRHGARPWMRRRRSRGGRCRALREMPVPAASERSVEDN